MTCHDSSGIDHWKYAQLSIISGNRHARNVSVILQKYPIFFFLFCNVDILTHSVLQSHVRLSCDTNSAVNAKTFVRRFHMADAWYGDITEMYLRVRRKTQAKWSVCLSNGTLLNHIIEKVSSVWNQSINQIKIMKKNKYYVLKFY